MVRGLNRPQLARRALRHGRDASDQLRPTLNARNDAAAPRSVALALHRIYNVGVAELRFEWDPAKGRANLRKHRVSFEDAQTSFADEFGLLIHDPDHSENEDRFVLLGVSSSVRMLIVCHCYAREGDLVRIISARQANRRERLLYNQRWNR